MERDNKQTRPHGTSKHLGAHDLDGNCETLIRSNHIQNHRGRTPARYERAQYPHTFVVHLAQL